MSGYLGTTPVVLSTTLADVNGPADISGDLTVDGNTDIGGDLTVEGNTDIVGNAVIDGNVGIGVVPSAWGSVNTAIQVRSSGFVQQDIVTNVGIGRNAVQDGPWSYVEDGYAQMLNLESDGAFKFFQAGSGTAGNNITFSEAMRIDSSGNLLVGKTALSGSTAGAELFSAGLGRFVRSGGDVLNLNRLSSDGTIADFQKDGSSVGSISYFSGGCAFVGNSANPTGIQVNGNSILPTTLNSLSDNVKDIGHPSYRWDDIYASNGTINTSDANEKQAIASLTAPELEAAKALSKLFKNFKWNDSVEEKGDAARLHTGVIAQEVEQALIDAGLDAGKYSFFISSDWIDEETGEERNRKGIRYPQLLSFVAAATEQRLTSIEARLDLIEGVPS